MRKPNYNFERKERDRVKAEKKAKRASDRAEAREKKHGVPLPSEVTDGQKASEIDANKED